MRARPEEHGRRCHDEPASRPSDGVISQRRHGSAYHSQTVHPAPRASTSATSVASGPRPTRLRASLETTRTSLTRSRRHHDGLKAKRTSLTRSRRHHDGLKAEQTRRTRKCRSRQLHWLVVSLVDVR